jgi:hypothetical protein
VGLHYGKSVSGRPCRRGGECCRRDDTRAWRAMSGRATASDETRRRRSRTATRRDGQRFARRVHACMSWYTMIYDNIGLAPGPGLICRGKGTETAFAGFLSSLWKLVSAGLYVSSSVCLTNSSAGTVYSSPTPVYEHHRDSRQVYSAAVLVHCYGATQVLTTIHQRSNHRAGHGYVTWT